MSHNISIYYYKDVFESFLGGPLQHPPRKVAFCTPATCPCFSPHRFIKTKVTRVGLCVVTWAFCCWHFAFCFARRDAPTLIRRKKKATPSSSSTRRRWGTFEFLWNGSINGCVVNRIDCPLHNPSSMVCEQRSLNGINRCEYCSLGLILSSYLSALSNIL